MSANKYATLFNLIVFVGEMQSEEFKSLLDLILEKFPVHLIYIHEKQHFQLVNAGENRTILEVESNNLSKVPFLILPHIIPDLPIYLLCGDDPLKEKEIIPSLQKWAKRLIFDCNPEANLSLWCKNLLDKVQSSQLDVVDMNWARVAGWRAILNQVFEGRDRLSIISGCESIKIVYNKIPLEQCPHPEIQALFLQSWLALQLGWKWQSIEKKGDDIYVNYKTAVGPLKIEIYSASEAEIANEELINLEVYGRDGESFILQRKDASQIIVHSATKALCYIPYTLPLSSLGKGRQFVIELLYRPVSENYHQILNEISRYGDF